MGLAFLLLKLSVRFIHVALSRFCSFLLWCHVSSVCLDLKFVYLFSCWWVLELFLVGTELLGSPLVQVLWCLQAFVSDEHIYIHPGVEELGLGTCLCLTLVGGWQVFRSVFPDASGQMWAEPALGITVDFRHSHLPSLRNWYFLFLYSFALLLKFLNCLGFFFYMRVICLYTYIHAHKWSLNKI